MAEVMLAVTPFHGHVAPMAVVAGAFAAAGHRVRVYTGAAHAAAFEAAGAEVVRWREAPDFDEHELAATFPELGSGTGLAQLMRNIEQLFIRTGAAQCRDLLAAYEARPWDVLVAESTSLGAAFAADRTATPWVTVCLTPLTLLDPGTPPPGFGIPPARGVLGRARDRLLIGVLRVLTRRLQRAHESERALAGLPPDGRTFDEACYSPELVCASGIAELDVPRPDSGRVRYVGALSAPPPDASPTRPTRALPEWWPELLAHERPVVHVTQGTQHLAPRDLVAPSFGALGRQEVLLVATTGRADAPGFPFPAPPNARIAGFVPHAELLPHVDVMITNGGWGGILAALSAGVPLIVAGGDADKPEAAARVGRSGAGIDLRTGRPSPRAVLRAYRTIAADPAYTANARRLARLLRDHDGPREVVELTTALMTNAADPA
ncbi:nucleotide disphospho-sugar-binding domain-containing protein [Agromyces sp. NPDC058104]|uniref:nucleotide disphospho-sugar-binding domain-containing protein n=1 Tax=Agromyces sp. NPDC058104 TaxID=3346342 RepID=UPI0036DC2A42